MPTLPQMSMYTSCALGAVGLVTGLLGLLASRRATSKPAAPVNLVALALGGIGAYVAATDHLAGSTWLLLTLAGLLLLFGAARSDRVVRAVATAWTFLRRLPCQWAALAVSCWVAAALVLFDAPRQVVSSPQMVVDSRPMESLPAAWLPPVVQMPSETALTDRHNEVLLWQAMLTAASEEKWKAGETWELQKLGLFGRVIPVAPADRSYNCSGWIFADGRYLVPDWEVEEILQDNDYSMIEKPAVGDLAVYRSDQGAICHTALVWGVGMDGQVLLESKWGWMGRFLHAPEATFFGPRWSYYHSPRSGHLLRGLQERPRNAPGTTS